MQKPKIIVIAHQKGGVGKSTIAANLAVELAKLFDLEVIDLDMQKSLAYFNSVRGKAGLPQFAIRHVKGVEELKTIINNNTKLLLIDVGGFDSDVNRIAILGADLIITPVSDSVIELIGLLTFKDILTAIRKMRPDLTAGILLNKVHPRATASLDELSTFIGDNKEFTKYNTIIRDRSEYKRAFAAGKSVVELNGKGAAEITQLIKEIQ